MQKICENTGFHWPVFSRIFACFMQCSMQKTKNHLRSSTGFHKIKKTIFKLYSKFSNKKDSHLKKPLKTWYYGCPRRNLCSGMQGVMACICNTAILEAEFRNAVGSIPVESNSPSIGGWIVWPPVIPAPALGEKPE